MARKIVTEITCCECLRTLPVSVFRSQSKMSLKTRTKNRKCPDCIRKWFKLWAERRRRGKGVPLRTDAARMAVNKEKKRVKSLARLKELNARMQREQPERLAELRRIGAAKWKRENPAKYLALQRATQVRHRAQFKKATPSWGQDGIGDVYLEAREFQMEVDHVVPLRSKVVCGLHVWDNLRVVPKSVNRAKRNHFDPVTFTGP